MQTENIRENQKGFSLVELIIVMAIMVVLVAVLAPQFTKYVQRARDSVIQDAANQALSMVRTEYALSTLKFTDDCQTITEDGKTMKCASIIVQAKESDNHLTMILNGLEYCGKTGAEADNAFMQACGVDEGSKTKSTTAYKITIKGDDSISTAAAFAINVEMSETEKDTGI